MFLEFDNRNILSGKKIGVSVTVLVFELSATEKRIFYLFEVI
jgi:hypothetical protein